MWKGGLYFLIASNISLKQRMKVLKIGMFLNENKYFEYIVSNSERTVCYTLSPHATLDGSVILLFEPSNVRYSLKTRGEANFRG